MPARYRSAAASPLRGASHDSPMRAVLCRAVLLAMLAVAGASLEAAATPPSGTGSVVTRTVWSRALGHSVRTLVYLPPAYDHL